MPHYTPRIPVMFRKLCDLDLILLVFCYIVFFFLVTQRGSHPPSFGICHWPHGSWTNVDRWYLVISGISLSPSFLWNGIRSIVVFLRSGRDNLQWNLYIIQRHQSLHLSPCSDYYVKTICANALPLEGFSAVNIPTTAWIFWHSASQNLYR